eukprot:jgi/Mesvir1/25964/Mv20952-RA.3
MDQTLDSEGAPALGHPVVGSRPAPSPAATAAVGVMEDDESDYLLGQFRWPVENFSRLNVKKMYSPSFTIGGHPWRILLFPRGNDCASLSVYIKAKYAAQQAFGCSRYAEFSLTLVNHIDPNRSVMKDTSHTFTPKETDWGFKEFFPLTELQRGGFIDQDTIVITASVRARKPQPADSFSYDSKETGYVGLKNQGATCYMNSLLQTIYHIPYFRRAEYHSPAGSIPLALQCLFYRLQYQEHSVATKDLTKSFGWDNYELFMQHDVQELNRILCENLEKKMKGTTVEGTIQRLFEGHTHNYISCVNVDYTSNCTESYLDLQLDVKGCKDVYASFDKYVAQEMMEGDNKYEAEKYGLQVAKKGVLFKDFPPVLQLQLKRFEYNFQRDIMVKINDRYEFPQELDLDIDNRKYLTQDADPSVRNLYELHSVLVHSGAVSGGHYYAFIRPDLGEVWYKFDDERVSKETAQKALTEQYGGEDENLNNWPGCRFSKYSSAYMLVYVRKSDKERIMCPVTEKSLAPHLQERLTREKQENERKKKEKAEAHSNTIMRVAMDEDLRNQIGKKRVFDLVDHEQVKDFRVKKQMLFGEFKEQVAKELGIPVEQQRYWTWAKRQNHTFRPTACYKSDENRQMSLLVQGLIMWPKPVNTKETADIKLFLETPVQVGPDVPMALPKKGPDDILLFFKLYDPVEEKLSYVGHSIVRSSCRVPDVCPLLRQLVGYAPQEPIHVYEEVKWEPEVMCLRLDERQTLKECQLETGDILCFQKVLSPEQAADCRFPEVPAYFNHVLNKQDVRFRQRKHVKEDDFVLELSKEDTYDEVVEKVVWQLQKMVSEGKKDGAALSTLAGGSLEPSKLRLTAHNCYQNVPKPQPIRYRGVDTLMGMLVHHNQTSDILYYEVLDIPLPEFERLKTLNVYLHNERTEEVAVLSVRLPKNSTVGDVLAVVKSMPECANMGELRMFPTLNSRIHKTFPPTESIANIDDTYRNLRVEEIPEEERRVGPRDKVISVCHFQRDALNSALMTAFGHPFLLAIGEHEKLASVKQRVQAKLGVPDEEFAKWKFAKVVGKSEYLADEVVVAHHFQNKEAGSWDHCLGLEHVDTRKTKRSQAQLRMGDALFVQKALSPDVAATCRFPDGPAFLGHALSQQRVRFCRLGVPTEEGFVLTLSKTDTYDQVAYRVLCELQQMVAEGRMDKAALDILCCRPAEPSNIWLTAHDVRANRPRSQPIQRGVAILKAMLADGDDLLEIGVDDASENGADDALKDQAEDHRFNLYGRKEAILYYEVVDPMRPERERFPRAIDVAVQDQGVKEVANFRVQLPLGSTVAELLKLVRAEPECTAMGELRLLKTHEGRIYHVMPPAEALDGIDDHHWNLRLEEVTGKGRCEGPGCALLPVSHVRRDEAGDSNDLVTAFGHPFMLAIGEHEKLASVKQRVQAKLSVPDEEFATWKFAIMVVDTAAPLDDNDEVVPRYQALRAGRWDAWLGIEHTGVPQAEACTQSCKGVAAPPENSTTRWSSHDHRWGDEREGQEGKRVSTCAICKRERRTLKGLDWKRELFSPTVAESPQLPAQDACAELQRALSLRPVDTWQLAGVTQRDGRVLWDTLLQMPALCTDITAADEEGRRLSSVCQQKEAVLMEAVAAARASPLDDAALSARDRALADQVAALQQLEEAYARKVALSAERAAQKERLEAVSETSAVAMDVGGNSGGGEGSLSVHRPHEKRELEEVAGSRDHMSGIIDGVMSEVLNGSSHPRPTLTLSTEAAPAPSSVAETTDGSPERMALGAQQKQRPVVGAMAGASGRGSSSGGAAGDPTGRVHGAGTGRVRQAFALAGSVIREFNNEMYPAAQATKAAMEQLAQCLVRERAVAERLRERLDRAHQVVGDAMGDAMRSLEDATPGEDAEQAHVLRALVRQKRQKVADAIAARKGLQPTEVRMGMLQRDLLEVRKKMALAEAHLKIAEMSDSEREAANQRVELGTLEEKQRAIVAALNRLTAEGQELARRLTHFYPEASALPERASQLSKALPGSSSQGKALPAGGGEGGDDVIDPDWSLTSFRNIGRPLGNSRVRLVEDAQGTPWVIKELCHERELRREGGRLQALRHPLVIRLERIFFDGGVAYLQMPYCKNGSLRAWFERIKGRAREGQPLGLEERQQVWVTMRQVFQAVAFIHRKGVVHRDLKPENILLQDDGQIALCDFGVSHDVSRTFQTTLATQLGGFTTAYAAPEVLTNQPSAKQWPFAQDMWSLGVMLLEILTGSLPHWNAVAGRLEDAQGEVVAIDAGLAGGQSQGDPWTTALRQLASSLLQVDPAGRPTSEDALSDPHGVLARDLTQVAMDQQRRMHALSSFLESLRRCPARAGRARVLQVADLDNRPQLVQQLLEAFQADGLDMRLVFSVECGGIRVPLSEVLDRFFQSVVLPEVGLFEQGREGREDVLPDTQLQEGVAFLPRKALQGGPAKQQHLRDLRAVGRVLAKAVLEFLHVPVRFATALCCFLVGDEQLSHATPSRCLELMAEFDPVVAGQMRSVLAIAHGSGQEHGMMASMLTRCTAKDDFAITDANKGAVVRQAVQRRLVEYCREELGALREGFLSLDDLMADHLKVMTGEVLVLLFFGQDYLDVDKAVKAFVFPDDAWRGAKNGKSFKEWLHRFIREVSETGLRLLCLRALGSVDGHQSCRVLPGGKTRELPTFELGTGCMYVPEACPDYTIFQARMHRALRAGEYGVRTDAQQEERLAKEEMDAVVGAMRGQVRAGGWYRCPNGHPYAIGDCGGAMQEARCPTCGSAIGGGQHRLRADNQNALEIDGAAAPAWPPQQ